MTTAPPIRSASADPSVARPIAADPLDAQLQEADLIELLSGIVPGSPLAKVRTHRAQARENAQRSFAALLEPASPGSFPLAERYAVALFVAQLHRFADAQEFYADVLADESSELVSVIRGLAPFTASRGPAGAYREPGLQHESARADRWEPEQVAVEALGTRLAAGLAHAHLLVFRPRESSPEALEVLARAGWSADDIVSLSQLVAFLTFQLRAAWGLRVLDGRADGAATGEAAAAGASAGSVPGSRPGPATGSRPGPATGSRPGSAAGTGAGPAAPATAPPAASDSAAPGTPEGLVTSYPELRRPERFTQQGLGWVPWLAPVAEADLTEEQLEALIEPARAQMPYFRLLARDPQALHARTLTDLDIFFNVSDGVGRAERELAATAASRHNGCVFCASVHSAAATRESGQTERVQRLLDDGVEADLGDPVWNAIVRASVALTNTPLEFGPDDVQGLREVGLGDLEIVDIVNGAAFFNWANRLMLSLGEPEVPSRRERA